MPTPSNTFAAGRSFAYRFLAEVFSHPEPEGWAWATSPKTRDALLEALAAAWPGHKSLAEAADRACRALAAIPLDQARRDQLRAFGYTIRGACPPHEIEYGDTKADALFRPHRLADLAALYRVFGLEMNEETHERGDHLAIECEFASILAARTANAIETSHTDGLEACTQAWKLFLREHLGRWTSAFVSRLATFAPIPWLTAVSDLLLAVVYADCALLGVKPGAADIQLVSYEEGTEAYCSDQCGMSSSAPVPT